MSFYCCKRSFNGRYFFIQNNGFENVKVEFRRCPVCGKLFYREIKTDFRGQTYNSTIKKGPEAEYLIAKAYLNRLDFLVNGTKGTKTNQNWYFGDFKKSSIRDEKGRLIEFQLKRDFNGVEVKNLGLARVKYY